MVQHGVPRGPWQRFFEVELRLDALSPTAVRVELYAEGVGPGTAERQEMTLLHPVPAEPGGYIFGASVSGGRVATDYTARAMPRGESLASPLEESRIVWQR